jgi:hypothetical protein
VRVAVAHGGTDYRKVHALVSSALGSPHVDGQQAKVTFTVDGVKYFTHLAECIDGSDLRRAGFALFVPFWSHAVKLKCRVSDHVTAFACCPCDNFLCNESGEKKLSVFIENDILRITWVSRNRITQRDYNAAIECAQCEYDQLGSVEPSIIEI